jgi:hypothetical protein
MFMRKSLSAVGAACQVTGYFLQELQSQSTGFAHYFPSAGGWRSAPFDSPPNTGGDSVATALG